MELKEIRRKIESVSNIRKLTGALETLSALKMKKSQKFALDSRPFAQKVNQLLSHIEPVLKARKDIFLRQDEVKKILAVVIASDRGFCGSFNQNVARLAEKEIRKMKETGEVEVFSVGKKATANFKKKKEKINNSFFGIGDYGELEEVKPISDYIIRAFIERKFQKVYIVWTDFQSTFFQKPRIMQLLPLDRESLREIFKEISGEKHEHETDPIIEPSLGMVGREIIPQLIEYLIYQCILESNASEHSARMVAMRNASDNAKKRVGELMLDYNKARQEMITREVTEISSAKEVLE
ncbi:MAG TPA: ATP synthase F1 subunit gamma [Candidatus Paceibacterota bacterium]|nr:ATP synthase F1 subunit gamma [Candidatus Pacearchaeota archaeon]HRZ51072.1 ATP synthase F1 subunit gamma [Candidatus Paceibacterota bacterium]HSA36769.1 ATP synthase F1 subunit gamma [Candidatus Paceibacterota bacterium]